jgi:hypothetical protein
MPHGWRTDGTSSLVEAKGYSQGYHCLQGILSIWAKSFWREVIVFEKKKLVLEVSVFIVLFSLYTKTLKRYLINMHILD